MGRWCPAGGRRRPAGADRPLDAGASSSTSVSRSACSSERRGSESGAGSKRSSAAALRSAPRSARRAAARPPRPCPRPGSGRRLPPLPAAIGRPPTARARSAPKPPVGSSGGEGRVAGRRLADPVVVLRRRLQLAALGRASATRAGPCGRAGWRRPSRPRRGGRRRCRAPRSRPRTSKVGGALRSSTVFWVPRRRASSSPSVTLWMPPMRSESVGFSIRFSSVLPWAVPTSCTPRSAMVRAAPRLQLGADLVDDDDLGHVVLDRLDHHRVLLGRACGTCMRRARPIAGCGMSPSPAISLRGVDDDHPLAEVVGQHARRLAQHRRLADAGAAEQQDAAARTRRCRG